MNRKAFLATAMALVCLVSPVLSQIVAGQTVRVRIAGVPAEEKQKIDGDYPVSEMGEVNLSFIGKIKAEGLQPDVLAKAIEDAYRKADIYANPKIHVITNHGCGGSPVIHIGGQVRKPGALRFLKGMTVSQAVEAAGGATELGTIETVSLWRNGKEQKIDLKTFEGKRIITEAFDTIVVHAK
jgi:polysaccharide export outer membrane protein